MLSKILQKLLLQPLLMIFLLKFTEVSYGWVETSPRWNYFGFASSWGMGSNNIPTNSLSKHVTGVELHLTTDNAIFSVNIIGDGVVRTA